jgi:hypothetical protein
VETYLSQQIQHSLRTPGHIHPHWNLVLDRHRQQRRWVDLEIRQA